MGMGYAASCGTSISYENLKNMCEKEVAEIESHSDFESWGDLALLVDNGLWDGIPESQQNLLSLANNLCNTFEKTTEGLKLSLTYYDVESAERYDEVEEKDGCIFDVDGVYQYTPAGEKFKDKLFRSSYVVFG